MRTKFGMVALMGALMVSVLSGCSARYWGGEATDNPGVRVRGGDFWRPAEVQMSSDATASLESMTFDQTTAKSEGKEDRTTSFDIKGFKLEQEVVAATEAQTAKLSEGVAAVMLTQAEYVRLLTEGVRSIFGEIMPVLRLLAMGNLMPSESEFSASFPNGITIGRRKVTSAADLQAVCADLVEKMEKLAPSTQPSS